MFGIGPSELVVILVIALLVLGPKRLPELARSLGKGLAEFRKATADFSSEFESARNMLEDEARQATRPADKRGKKGPETRKPAPAAADDDEGEAPVARADQARSSSGAAERESSAQTDATAEDSPKADRPDGSDGTHQARKAD